MISEKRFAFDVSSAVNDTVHCSVAGAPVRTSFGCLVLHKKESDNVNSDKSTTTATLTIANCYSSSGSGFRILECC